MKLKHVVIKEEKGLFLKEILRDRLKISARLFRKIMEKKAYTLNGSWCYSTNRVKHYDVIIVDLDLTYDESEIDNIYSKYIPWNHSLDIIYEDEYLLCINKESNVPCHPSSNHIEKTLYQAVVNYYLSKGKKTPIHIVNRLDKDTTGIVIFAKHKYIQEFLIKQMKEGIFKKEYIAIVYGKLESDKGIIEKRIKRKPGSIILRETTDSIEDSEYAKTGYEVLSYNEKNNYSVLKINLYTGRTHQIRVHLSSIGHPILGDELYIKESTLIEKEDIFKYINRQALHACRVHFLYIDNKVKNIYANIGKDMEKIVNYLHD